MNWLRFYTDSLDNPKVQRLSPELFRAWVNMLCLARLHDGILPPIEDIAFRLRVTTTRAAEWVSALTERRFLEQEGDSVIPHDWDEHQYPSDDSAGRKRRQRARQKTGQSRDMSRDNVGTSPVLDQNRIEQSRAEQNGRSAPPASPVPEKPPDPPCSSSASDTATRMYARHPKKRHRTLVEQAVAAIAAAHPEKLAAIEECHAAWSVTPQWTEQNGRYAPPLDEWLVDEGYEQWPEGAGPPAQQAAAKKAESDAEWHARRDRQWKQQEARRAEVREKITAIDAVIRDAAASKEAKREAFRELERLRLWIEEPVA